jgi:hypothetical protein
VVQGCRNGTGGYCFGGASLHLVLPGYTGHFDHYQVLFPETGPPGTQMEPLRHAARTSSTYVFMLADVLAQTNTLLYTLIIYIHISWISMADPTFPAQKCMLRNVAFF